MDMFKAPIGRANDFKIFPTIPLFYPFIIVSKNSLTLWEKFKYSFTETDSSTLKEIIFCMKVFLLFRSAWRVSIVCDSVFSP